MLKVHVLDELYRHSSNVAHAVEVPPGARLYADVLREDRAAVVLADRLGYREAFIGDWSDPALARRSMELVANEVWPRIDRALPPVR